MQYVGLYIVVYILPCRPMLAHNLMAVLKSNILVVVFFAFAAGGVESVACRDGWVRFSDSCYAFVDEKVRWSTAMDICRILRGNLVEIETDAENNFMTSAIGNRGLSSIWLGFQDFLKEGTFVSSTNLQPATFSKWRPGEPNNVVTLEQGQDCVILTFTSQWDDYWCDNTHVAAVVCEYYLESGISVIG